MKRLFSALMAASALLVAAPVAQAANVRKPYANVDHRNDAGNDTGDSQVDRLNEMQLDRNYTGPRYPIGPSMPPGGPRSGYAPPAGGPPPGYAPPPGAPRPY
ncbi:MAG: hypothetical protein ACRYHQ_00885 [Janthinobacterium lividum]